LTVGDILVLYFQIFWTSCVQDRRIILWFTFFSNSRRHLQFRLRWTDYKATVKHIANHLWI